MPLRSAGFLGSIQVNSDLFDASGTPVIYRNVGIVTRLNAESFEGSGIKCPTTCHLDVPSEF
jgi:hypothetical protein